MLHIVIIDVYRVYSWQSRLAIAESYHEEESMSDPTGEYQRQQRKLHVSRRGALIGGWLQMVFSGCGVLLVLFLLGTMLWTHDTGWQWYVGDVMLLSVCVVSVLLGWSGIRRGRQAITHQEVIQAKQAHRQELQQAVRGDLPSNFSKVARYIYLGLALIFGALVIAGWYAYARSGKPASTDVMGTLIGTTAFVAIMLLMFLTSFAGKAYQRESATELKRILQAGEFASSEDESRNN